MDTAKYDLKCKAGTTFSKSFTFKDRNDNLLDFTGYSARMQVRPTLDSDTVLVQLDTDYESDPPTTGAYGTITIDVETATITLLIDDETTSDFEASTYVYDLEIVSPGGFVDAPLMGKFRVTGEVTR